MTTMTRREEFTRAHGTAPMLLLAFELGESRWKLGFTVGLGQKPRCVQIPARDTKRVLEEITRAKVRFGLLTDVPVMSCYEAGRDGFWLHRWLVAHGVSNHVIDSSSIEVNRRARRAKTDCAAGHPHVLGDARGSIVAPRIRPPRATARGSRLGCFVPYRIRCGPHARRHAVAA